MVTVEVVKFFGSTLKKEAGSRSKRRSDLTLFGAGNGSKKYLLLPRT